MEEEEELELTPAEKKLQKELLSTLLAFQKLSRLFRGFLIAAGALLLMYIALGEKIAKFFGKG